MLEFENRATFRLYLNSLFRRYTRVVSTITNPVKKIFFLYSMQMKLSETQLTQCTALIMVSLFVLMYEATPVTRRSNCIKIRCTQHTHPN